VIVADKGFYELCPEFTQGDPKIVAWGHGDKYTAEVAITREAEMIQPLNIGSATPATPGRIA
jgi:hypothetical protein